MRHLWVDVTTDIDPPPPPHLIVDRDGAQHKGREELSGPLSSSADEVAVTFATSNGAYILSPTSSCGILEGSCQALKIPLYPDANIVVHTGDIPQLLSPPPLHPDIRSEKNCGGDIRNTNEEGVPVQVIAYVLEE